MSPCVWRSRLWIWESLAAGKPARAHRYNSTGPLTGQTDDNGKREEPLRGLSTNPTPESFPVHAARVWSSGKWPWVTTVHCGGRGAHKKLLRPCLTYDTTQAITRIYWLVSWKKNVKVMDFYHLLVKWVKKGHTFFTVSQATLFLFCCRDKRPGVGMLGTWRAWCQPSSTCVSSAGSQVPQNEYAHLKLGRGTQAKVAKSSSRHIDSDGISPHSFISVRINLRHTTGKKESCLVFLTWVITSSLKSIHFKWGDAKK